MADMEDEDLSAIARAAGVDIDLSSVRRLFFAMRDSLRNGAGVRSPAAAAAPAAAESAVAPSRVDYERLALTVPVYMIERGRPLIEQSPFVPAELASVDLGGGPAEMPITVLSADTQSGKTPAIGSLCLRALSQGAWVLLILNMPSNAAINGLCEKLRGAFRALGIAMPIVWDDGAFTKPNRATFDQHVEALEGGYPAVWVCKADARQMQKLVSRLSDATIRRCVVIIDEVHCMFTLRHALRGDAFDAVGEAGEAGEAGEVQAGRKRTRVAQPKQAEVGFLQLLCGDGEGPRVRALVLVDATDADVPHVLAYLRVGPGGFRRLRADPDTLRRRGYVAIRDFELFRGGLDKPLASRQRFGKDHEERLPSSLPKPPRRRMAAPGDSAAAAAAGAPGPPVRTYSGVEFAREVTLAHFHPLLRDFAMDALGSNGRFMLELTSPNRSELTDNSVEHHAYAMARLFPGAVALAEHGRGCFHRRADGTSRRYERFADAYEDLLAGAPAPQARAPVYLITNLGNGSITYARRGMPVTHVYLGFREGGECNLLVKTQALGRATGYVAADLAACGVERVRVLCTARDFEAMREGLPGLSRRMFEQFPDHGRGVYADRTHVNWTVAHRSNPRSAAMRLTARIEAADAAEGVTLREPQPSAQDPPPADRSALHASVERPEALRVLNHGDLRGAAHLLPEAAARRAAAAGLVLEEAVDVFDDAGAEGAQVTTRVFYVTCPSAAAADQVERLPRPSASDVGRAVAALQDALVPEKQRVTIKSGFLRRGSRCTAKKFNTNPGRIGSKGGADAFRYLWARESPESARFVVMLRAVGFDDMRLPLVYHLVRFDGRTTVEPRLVTRRG